MNELFTLKEIFLNYRKIETEIHDLNEVNRNWLTQLQKFFEDSAKLSKFQEHLRDFENVDFNENFKEIFQKISSFSCKNENICYFQGLQEKLNTFFHYLRFRVFQISYERNFWVEFINEVLNTQTRKNISFSLEVSTKNNTKQSFNNNLSLEFTFPEIPKYQINIPPHANFHPSKLSDQDMDLKINDQIPKHQVYEGFCSFENLGNTCYLNSVLQCLINTDVLFDFFLNANSTEIVKSSKLLEEFRELIRKIWNNPQEYQTIRPYLLKIQIEMMNLKYAGYHQHDANQLILEVLKNFDESLSSVQNNFIFKNFSTSISSSITCLKCKEKLRNDENLLILPVPYMKYSRLEDCLKLFFQEKTLFLLCDRCKGRQNAKKETQILNLPQILILQLQKTGKSENEKKFPLENLNLDEFCVSSQKGEKYNLYAVCVHHEYSLDFGHYFAFIKKNGKWYKMDDDKEIREITEEELYVANSYILFYEKSCFLKKKAIF